MTSSSDIVGKKIWAVAGGKGGTGKSVISANIGIALASLGHKVILIDADLGAPNLHTCLNIRRPSFTLNDFLNKNVPDLNSILLETPNENLKLISGGSEILGLANIQHQKKMKMLRHLEKLDGEFIIVDLGAGTAYNTIDFFNISNEGILICNPEPNAKLDTYSFLKNVVWRRLLAVTKNNGIVKEIINKTDFFKGKKTLEVEKLLQLVKSEDEESFNKMNKVLNDFSPRLIMNKVRRKSQIAEANQLVILAKEFLNIEVKYLGYIALDYHVVDSSEKMLPFILTHRRCGASKNIFQIVKTLIEIDRQREKTFRTFKKDMKSEARKWK